MALTTEVENYPGFPPGNIGAFVDSAVSSGRKALLTPRDPVDAAEQHSVTGPELVELIRAQAVHFGTRVVTDDVVDVDFTGSPLKLIGATGNVYETHTVVIATGASANYLGLPSETRFKNRGVSACAVCDGALPRFRDKPVAVVGGGDAAVEEAEYLTKYASKVFLTHRRNELRASKIVAERARKNPKIEILWNRVPVEVLGDDERGVTGLRLDSTVGEPTLEIAVSGMFLAVGHTPNTGFLEGKIDLEPGGFIARPVPFRTNTSVPGVFTAGDVADRHYRQAISAAGTGCMAALDAERYLAAMK